jgi:hypothetical protein
MFVFQEIPAESLRNDIQIITGDNTVLISAGNIKLYGSSVASCRYASELTFKPIAVCFLRPQRTVIRFFEKNEYFTLSYFPPRYQHILQTFSAERIEPNATKLGNIYYPQADWIFECRKISNPELILSHEIQGILASEKKLSIYPVKEIPVMFVGEIINGWHKTLKELATEDSRKLLPEIKKSNFLSLATMAK